jgi:hypothetical protein
MFDVRPLLDIQRPRSSVTFMLNEDDDDGKLVEDYSYRIAD